MNTEENQVFSSVDEPFTTAEIARRLNEPPRRVRNCYRSLLSRLPNHPNLQPLSDGRERLLSAATANKIANTLRGRKFVS
jgi:hypothetical protein